MSGSNRHPTIRKRVVAIFLIAVMLPCLFLSYIGLKSIKQEKVWQQQLVLQNLKGSLSLAIDRIETNIEEQTRGFFNSFSLPTSSPTSDYLLSLQELQDQHSIVDQVLLIDDNFQLVFPRTFRNHETSFNGRRPTFALKKNEHLQAGDSLEARGELEEAINEYQKGITASTSVHGPTAYLARIARCEFKKNDLQSARQTYLKILAEDRGHFDGEEVPYVLIAYSQLVTIAERVGSPREVANRLTDFYKMLLENFNYVERGQFEFYLEQVKTKLANQTKRVPSLHLTGIDKLKEREKEVEREQALGNSIQLNLVPGIREEVSLNKKSEKIQYLAATINDTVWRVAFQRTGQNSSLIQVVGCRIRNSILNSLIQKVFDQIHVSEEIKLAFIRNEQEVVLPAGYSIPKVVLIYPFVSMTQLFPNLKVGIVAIGENPVEAISAKSLTIYYILVFSIIVTIVLGVVLIFRDISREQQLSKMKSEFIANVSHEIKTPIATIRTLAENLNEGWITDQQKRGEYYHLIARESERLTHLVENILDFSRIEAERKAYRMEVVSVSDVLNKTLERFRLLVDGQGVTFSRNVSSDLPQAKMDPEAIEQALLNLLDNAVKYSNEEKLIEVSAEALEEDVVIKVVDHGRGIKKSELQKVFEKFYRVESRDGKNVPGSGIGLTLVKEIIEAHGGKIEVESEIDKGSTFSLYIPINSA